MDADGRRGKWRPIALAIMNGIRSGQLKRGDRIPSSAELAQQYGVAPRTARKAVDALKATGTLRGEQGSGVYVAGPAPDSLDDLDRGPDLEQRMATAEERLDDHEVRTGLLEASMISLYSRLGLPWPGESEQTKPKDGYGERDRPAGSAGS